MNTNIKVALSGGGSAGESRLLDERFAKWIGRKGKLLYLPIAMRGIIPFPSCFEWITNTFTPLGVTNMTMWTDLSAYKAADLEAFDGVYMGGGNTYSLLAELRESGFADYLPAFIRQGYPVYGGSAGAAVLGQNIRTVAHIDENNAGITDLSALNMVDGHAIWVHYQPTDDLLIQAYVETHKHPVLAISERSGIVLERCKIERVGFEPAYRFDKYGKSEV